MRQGERIAPARRNPQRNFERNRATPSLGHSIFLRKVTHTIPPPRLFQGRTRLSGSHMWTAPCLQELAVCRSKRLRSYVRSVDAVAQDRCQDGFPQREFQTVERHETTIGSRGVSRVLDRSITPSAPLPQASALARGEFRGRAERQVENRTAAIVVLIMFDHSPSLTDGHREAPRASAVKADRRPPPQAARSGLDGASTALNFWPRETPACAGFGFAVADGSVRR